MNECYKVVRIRENKFWSVSPISIFLGGLFREERDGEWGAV